MPNKDMDALENLFKLFQAEFAEKYLIKLPEIKIYIFCHQLIHHSYTPFKLVGYHYLPASPSKIMEKMPLICEKDLIKINAFLQSSPYFTRTLKVLFKNQVRLNIAFNKGCKVSEELEQEIDSTKHRPPIIDFEETADLVKILRRQNVGYLFSRAQVKSSLFRFKNESRFRKMPRSKIFLDYDFIAAVTICLFDLVPATRKVKTIDLCASIKKIIERAISVETTVKITLPIKTYNSQLKAFSLEKAQTILTESSLPLFSSRVEK